MLKPFVVSQDLSHHSVAEIQYRNLILGDATLYVEQLGLNNYKCGLCAKTFSVKSNCTRHVKINHLGEVRDADTKQPCYYCGKYLVKRTIAHHVKKSCPKAPGNLSYDNI